MEKLHKVLFESSSSAISFKDILWLSHDTAGAKQSLSLWAGDSYKRFVRLNTMQARWEDSNSPTTGNEVFSSSSPAAVEIMIVYSWLGFSRKSGIVRPVPEKPVLRISLSHSSIEMQRPVCRCFSSPTQLIGPVNREHSLESTRSPSKKKPKYESSSDHVFCDLETTRLPPLLLFSTGSSQNRSLSAGIALTLQEVHEFYTS